MGADRTPVLSHTIHESGMVIVSITGDLDTYGVRQVETEFAAAIPDRRAKAVVDLSGVVYISSAALAMFVVKAQAMSHAGGRLTIAAAQPQVIEVFEWAGFATVIPLYDTLEDAIVALDE